MDTKKRRRNDGFTEPMRKWILARDNNMCQLCESKESLQVHHIVPWRYGATVLHWTMERVNNPTNGISLCKACHIGDTNAIHPDIPRAARAYSQDKNSYGKVFAERDQLCRQNMPYWMTGFDNHMAVIAVNNTMRHIANGNFPTPWIKKEGDEM